MIEETNAFKMHELAPRQGRIVICVVLRSGTQVKRLERIEQSAHAVFTFPYTPFGYHTSYHDADDEHPKGRIHVRLDPRRGTFRVFPGGGAIGQEAGACDAPPFAVIKGVVPVPPGSMGFVNIRNLVAQSPAHKHTREIDHTIEIDVSVLRGDLLGRALLLVEPGNTEALSDWLTQEKSARLLSRVSIETVSLYQAFHPWLAVVIASLAH